MKLKLVLRPLTNKSSNYVIADTDYNVVTYDEMALKHIKKIMIFVCADFFTDV